MGLLRTWGGSLTSPQADCHSFVFPSSSRFSQIYQRDSPDFDHLSRNSGSRSFLQGRHHGRPWRSPRYRMVRPRSCSLRLPSHSVCIHMSPECELTRLSVAYQTLTKPDVFDSERNLRQLPLPDYFCGWCQHWPGLLSLYSCWNHWLSLIR